MEKRLNNFDFLRFVLAALVIYWHCLVVLLGAPAARLADPVARLTLGQVSGGELAVDAFFAISGFLIIQSRLYSRNAWTYLQKRVARIYPGYLACATVCLILFGPVAAPLRSILHLKALAHYLFDALGMQEMNLRGAFHTLPFPDCLNGSAWTILYEFWCYLLLMALAPLLARRRFIAPLLLAVFLALSARRQPFAPPFFDNLPVLWGGEWPRLAGYFLAGCAAYLYRDYLPRRRPALLAAITALILTFALGRGFWLSGPLLGTYLLLRFAFSPRVRLHQFARRGDFSYGLYLYAFPIQQSLVRLFGPGLAPALLFALSFPATLLFAALSWHFVEKPFLALKPR